MVLFILAVLNILLWGIVGLQFFVKIKEVNLLKDVGEQSDKNFPFVSGIIPARNEEKAIHKCIESLCSQTYEQMEVIVVNDRSTDQTGSILEALKIKHPSIHVLTLENLPENWLGKSHALYQGSLDARGDWLLFTDGDVLFRPTTIELAVTYSEENGLDHLTVVPEFIGNNFWSKVFATFIFLTACAFGQFWNVKKPQSKSTFGLGAFNLIKSSTYRKIGTHEAFSMNMTDDFTLGKLVKINHFRQDVLFGKEMLYVWDWYESMGQMFQGMEKNAHNLSIVAAQIIGGLLTTIYPFVGLLLGDGTTKVLNLISVAIILGMYAFYSRFFNNPPWFGFLHPVMGLLVIIGIFRGALKRMIFGRVDWRGTQYSSKNLR